MKKKIAFALLMSASSSYALSLCPTRSEGFLELGLGYGSVKSSVNGAGLSPIGLTPNLTSGYLYAGTTALKKKCSQKGFLSSFGFGYNANFTGSPLMVGFILGMQVGTVNGKIKAPINIINNADKTSTYYAANYTRLKSKFGSQAAIRLGVWWRDNLPFFKVGWACLRTTFKSPRSLYPQPNNPIYFKGTRRFFNGIVMGLGWDTVVRKHCAMGLAADLTMYSRKRCVFFKNNYQSIVARTRPTSFSFMATLKYLLPENKGAY
jgi:hypothetical protein